MFEFVLEPSHCWSIAKLRSQKCCLKRNKFTWNIFIFHYLISCISFLFYVKYLHIPLWCVVCHFCSSFARLMSRNEVIWDAKRLMQQSLSHGAPNPKLEKLKEVLIDHFSMCLTLFLFSCMRNWLRRTEHESNCPYSLEYCSFYKWGVS